MVIFLVMLLIGVLMGFVGAGGAGVTIAVLDAVFGVPVHTALGTALAGMAFTTFSGAVSHFREGDVDLRLGCALGLFGALGACAGAAASADIAGETLRPFTGGMLILTAILFYMKAFRPDSRLWSFRLPQRGDGMPWGWIAAFGLGNGLLAGLFGIGAAPFIQLTLLAIFLVPLYRTVGTTMLVILPIAAAGGLGYLLHGHLDPILFLQVTGGQVAGAYLGAKLTRLAPILLLRCSIVTIPAVGGLILLRREIAGLLS